MTTTMFKVDYRTDGTRYWRLTDDAPDWMQEAVYAAHDDELPDDWRYAMCAGIWSELQTYDGDLDDFVHEVADGLTPVYYYDVIQWLAGHNGRVYWLDEVLTTLGPPENGRDILFQAMYLDICNMASIIVDAYRTNT